MRRASLLVCLLLLGSASARAGIDENSVAVVANDADPDSREISAYYVATRRIPKENLFHVRLPRQASVSEAEFARVRAALMAAMPARIEAIAITWLRPYRVDCMSITSAFAFGFDERYCASGCRVTEPSRLYGAETRLPYTDLGIRPTMMLAAGTVGATRALIDRGVEADGWLQAPVDAHLVTTDDARRNVREAAFARLHALPPLHVHPVKATTFPRVARNVMFYFTGAVRVPYLDSIVFVPGAIADHVTSWGAIFDQSRQTTVLDWLSAGATGSYGTVVEPCAIPDKFPDPDIVVRRYAEGQPLIEAYWKGVRMPGQGLFVGEPLARPFGPS